MFGCSPDYIRQLKLSLKHSSNCFPSALEASCEQLSATLRSHGGIMSRGSEVFTKSQTSLCSLSATCSRSSYPVFTGYVSNQQEHFDPGHTQTTSPSANSSPTTFTHVPPTSQHQQYHLPQQRNSGGYATYYSPLPLDPAPTSSCPPYPLPTPPLTAPIHPLRYKAL